jgi:hypothetical protein
MIARMTTGPVTEIKPLLLVGGNVDPGVLTALVALTLVVLVAYKLWTAPRLRRVFP